MTFNELGVDSRILKAIEELGFERPMPVQAETLPVLLSNDTDLVALAQTGTGKTAAFGIPIIQKLDTANRDAEALILCPTRELCIQITDDCKRFAKYMEGVSIVAVYGGASIETQKKALRKGAKIIVATPGRMVDLSERGYVDLSNVKRVVLDEADEMLNMGFKEDLDFILSQTPDSKNTLLFSATMPIEVERIAKNYMSDPMKITIGTRNSGSKNVHHYYYLVHAKDRYNALKRIADYYPNIYSIVFCRTRAETQEIADALIKDGYNADALHGDLSQAQRDAVMKRFRSRQLQMLVATDVAARGLDVNDLTHVINYNMPDEVEQYTHRSGRTGRADKTGISIAIINLREKGKIKQTEKIIGQKFTQAKIPNGKEICEKQLFNIIDHMENIDVQYETIEDYLPIIYKKLEWLDREELIRRFVSVEFNRFLEYYRGAPDLNVAEEEHHEKGDRQSRRDRSDRGDFTRMFFNLGRFDKMEPTRIIGLVNDAIGKRHDTIGRIELYDSFSHVDIKSEFVEELMNNLNGKKLKGRPIVVDIASRKKSEGKKNEGRRSEGRKSEGKKSHSKQDYKKPDWNKKKRR